MSSESKNNPSDSIIWGAVPIKKVRTFFSLKGVWGRKVISVICQLKPSFTYFLSDFAPISCHRKVSKYLENAIAEKARVKKF